VRLGFTVLNVFLLADYDRDIFDGYIFVEAVGFGLFLLVVGDGGEG